MLQFATRVDDLSGETFKSLTRQLGITPADAMRMFVMAFNSHRGFPYEVRLSDPAVPFKSEEEALDFVDGLSTEMLSDAR